MVTKYFNCHFCGNYTPISKLRKASKYCSRSCRGKAYYRRKKANAPPIYHLHGLSKHPLYSLWEEMKRRCYNTEYHRYKDYGGRGIKVCERWMDAANYIADIEALGSRPTANHTLDRIDNNADYGPSNIQWASQTAQNYNQRIRKDNQSGHRGVYYDKARNRWAARVQKHGKLILMRRFKTLEEAVAAQAAAFEEVRGATT